MKEFWTIVLRATLVLGLLVSLGTPQEAAAETAGVVARKSVCPAHQGLRALKPVRMVSALAAGFLTYALSAQLLKLPHAAPYLGIATAWGLWSPSKSVARSTLTGLGLTVLGITFSPDMPEEEFAVMAPALVGSDYLASLAGYFFQTIPIPENRVEVTAYDQGLGG